jgi:hypothetical protein
LLSNKGEPEEPPWVEPTFQDETFQWELFSKTPENPGMEVKASGVSVRPYFFTAAAG